MSSIPGAFARSTCRCADSECEHRKETIPELHPKPADRVKDQIYINKKGEKVIWNGNRLHCEHGREKSRCKESHYLCIMPTREEIPNDFMRFVKNGRVIKGTWKKKENHKIYADWLGKQLGYKTKEDWYKINTGIINKTYGSGLIKCYGGSLFLFLKNVFPKYNWLEWKFTKTPQNTWVNKDGIFKMENHIKYVLWLGLTLDFKCQNDWYKLTSEVIYTNNGGGLLHKCYEGSCYLLLKSVFPKDNWLAWLFTTTPYNFWNSKTEKEYANWLGKKVGFKNEEDWYNISREILIKNNGGGYILEKHNGSPASFVMNVFPDYPWDLSKFKKNYSQGEIEWLICLSIEKYPDIRHALNEEGQYLIPNSRYHADGYSKTKNTIFEYNGDYYHGNPEFYNQKELYNKRTKTTYGEKYIKTLKKQSFCEESGYNYISIWESEWFRFKDSIIHLQRIFKKKQEANV